MEYKLDIDSIFSHHPPATKADVDLHARVRRAAKLTALVYGEELPDCPEKIIAIRKLQEAMMFANSAVAQHNGKV